MSRFLTQMKYEHIIKPEIRNLSFDIKSHVSVRNEFERTTDHQSALYSRYLDRLRHSILSPTAINMWLNCRMKFYYRYVNGLRESQTIPVEIDYALFGSMLHNVMKHIYKPFSGMEMTHDVLGTIISDRNHLASLIDLAASETSRTEPGIPLAGKDLIVRDVLGIFLSRILEADRSITPFRIVALEESFEFSIPIVFDNSDHLIKTGGNIDRIDITCGTTRIVDYKTGDIARKINSVTDLFEDDRKKDIDAWLQTLLYCEAYRNQNKDSVLKPSIYVVKELTTEKFLDTLKIRVDRNNEIEVNDYNEVRSIFLSGLEEVIKEIFNPEEPFRMTRDIGKCIYCPYKLLCQR
jgi:CRISPR/Cas system-associated exonuclease Cas4 (RecB family)